MMLSGDGIATDSLEVPLDAPSDAPTDRPLDAPSVRQFVTPHERPVVTLKDVSTSSTPSERQFSIPNCKSSQYFNDPFLSSGVVHVLRDGGCEMPWDQGWKNVLQYFAGQKGKLKAETLIKFLELLD